MINCELGAEETIMEKCVGNIKEAIVTIKELETKSQKKIDDYSLIEFIRLKFRK